MTDDLTRDGFLGGRVTVWQPAAGYRAGNDPVLLAAACGAGPGDSVLDLGAGVGVASLCLSWRVGGLRVTAVERQRTYAELARRNASENGLTLEVVEADLAALPPDLRRRSFDHVIANPPYFARGAGTPARDAGRAGGRQEDTPLATWLSVAAARLGPKGWLTLIQVAERLPACLAAMRGFGGIAVRPLQSRPGRDAGRVILRARKGARAPFRLLPPLLLHERAGHGQDGGDYTPEMTAILREGRALDWPRA
ncbi:MAG: tRNA1(Val) (adenine(37)-N6)-methyltransferase [Roseicyclus sp.]